MLQQTNIFLQSFNDYLYEVWCKQSWMHIGHLLDIKPDTDIISMADYAYSGFHLPGHSRMQTGNAGIPTIREAALGATNMD